MPARPGPGAVFLLTDYGTVDEFAGLLRAVVARMAPGVPLVDLTHDIPRFDVRAGALALERAVPHLGPGVVLGVVDPGVGTGRRAVALAVGPSGPSGSEEGTHPTAMVGPDNGLLVWAAGALGGITAAVSLPHPAGAAATFDGRDVFAPAAAALVRGTPLEALGEPLTVDDLVRLPAPRRVLGAGRIETEVLWVDRFGNVQLAADGDDGRMSGLLDSDIVELLVRDTVHRVRVARAFGDLAGWDGLGVLLDANGRLAIVCNQRSAATVLGMQAGETVTLRLPERDATSGGAT